MTSTLNRLLHTIPDTQEQLGIGRSYLYELIKSGEIQTLKIGRRTLITHEELTRYVRSLVEAGGPNDNR
jgi:excisionase family DNA binding protein